MKTNATQSEKLVSKAELKRTVGQIVECFQPERVILFGSYAEGRANRHSDVDLLVVMPARNEISQAVAIRMKLNCQFPLDLIVRTPEKLQKRLELGDSFLKDVIEHGLVMYAKADCRMSPKGRSRPVARRTRVRSKTSAQ